MCPIRQAQLKEQAHTPNRYVLSSIQRCPFLSYLYRNSYDISIQKLIQDEVYESALSSFYVYKADSGSWVFINEVLDLLHKVPICTCHQCKKASETTGEPLVFPLLAPELTSTIIILLLSYPKYIQTIFLRSQHTSVLTSYV